MFKDLRSGSPVESAPVANEPEAEQPDAQQPSEAEQAQAEQQLEAEQQPEAEQPEAEQPARYRCVECGNLTRFDVIVARRCRAFHHYTLGGQLVVEDEQVLSEFVEDVSCRWCGHGRAIERVGAIAG
jgi:hypothetical protein